MTDEEDDIVIELRQSARSYGHETRIGQRLLKAANELETLREHVADMTGDNTTQFQLVETEKLRTVKQAIRNLFTVTKTCPCGAWLGNEAQRPHVLGCPVALALEYLDEM